MNLVEPSFDATTFTKNRERLLKHRVGQALFDEVVLDADRRGLLSDEHFTVDGTLIEAAASLKSFKPTFPIWLNIPLSKSSAFFKPLSICETLAVGMAIITP